eukprot:CAMPEP_0172475628 /NCGR_PEP_ID=MMETSP1065-20121228/69968_1 /TAXON_ID=265537 /ORGANISM="Amphiprora paludosa, Strain CCMP125" /LENGTH=1452 /DNA_ID=CAMNT_0013233839 /DNA_START=11 /DNA_END=4369 /DNA_ORIENTATION=+
MSTDFALDAAGLSVARHVRGNSAGGVSATGSAVSNSSSLRSSSPKPWQRPAFKAPSTLKQEETSDATMAHEIEDENDSGSFPEDNSPLSPERGGRPEESSLSILLASQLQNESTIMEFSAIVSDDCIESKGPPETPERARTPLSRLSCFSSPAGSMASRGSDRSLEKMAPLSTGNPNAAIPSVRHSDVQVSGPLKSVTDGTAPPSDSSESTDPYHSDEEGEHQIMEVSSPAPAITDSVAAESPIRRDSISRSAESASSPVPVTNYQSPTRSPPRNNSTRDENHEQGLISSPISSPKVQHQKISNRRFPDEEQDESGDGDTNSYIPKALQLPEVPDKSKSQKRAVAKRASSQPRAAPEQPPRPHPSISQRSKSSSRLPPTASSPSGKNSKQKKKGIFGRTASPAPARETASVPPKPSTTAAIQKADSRRSWFGSFRNKKQEKSEALVVVSPDGTKRITQSAPSEETNSAAAESTYDTTAILVRRLTDVPDAEVSPESTEQALRELELLQAEVARLRSSPAASGGSAEVEQLRNELDAAQKAAAQLEGLNKNYRKAQKQMLQDLQDSQMELQRFRDSRSNVPGDSQRLTQELASTTAELMALKDQHQMLLQSTSPRNGADGGGFYDSVQNDNPDDETRLNLQKDLAQAMATISKLEDENHMLRKRLMKLDNIEERLLQAEFERDEYLSQLNDQDPRGMKGVPADAVVMITRLQREKRQLLSRETVLKEKIGKLQTKNENQKAIFQTAVEIKEVEMKITQKERDIFAARLEEHKRDRNAQTGNSSRELELLQSRLNIVEEERRESDIRVNALTEQAQELQSEVDAKKTEIVSLQKRMKDSEHEALEELELVSSDLNKQIMKLKDQIMKSERDIADLQEQGRLESFKARRVMDDKVNHLQRQIDNYENTLIERDEMIKKLEEDLKVRGGELQDERKKALRRSSPGPDNQSPEDNNRSERLTELRNRLGNYENVMRAKVDKIRQMDASPPKDSSPEGRAQSQPALVVATPVASENPAADEKYTELEKSLRKSDIRIRELESELVVARTRLDQAENVEPGTHQSSHEIAELTKSLKESDDQVAELHDQLAEARAQLAEAQSSGHTAIGQLDESQVEAEMATLLSQLAEKEESCTSLQKRIDALQAEKEDASTKYRTAEGALVEAQTKYEDLEAQLLRVSKDISEDKMVSSSGPSADDGRVQALEHELAATSAKLAEADSKIEMLEEFIHEDTHTMLNTSVASTIDGGMEDVGAIKESLREKEHEIDELKTTCETAKEQLSRARKNVEELEQEKAHSQAKLTQLSSIVEKQGKDETDMQLYKKCIEVAEVSHEKEELSQKLRMANAVIKRLEEEIEGSTQGADPEERSTASTAQMSIRLTETELKLDELREKLSAAEKESRTLRDQNDKMIKKSKSGLSADDEMMHKMRFLEEQNAAYSAALKALRIEIATRHVGTAFE